MADGKTRAAATSTISVTKAFMSQCYLSSQRDYATSVDVLSTSSFPRTSSFSSCKTNTMTSPVGCGYISREAAALMSCGATMVLEAKLTLV